MSTGVTSYTDVFHSTWSRQCWTTNGRKIALSYSDRSRNASSERLWLLTAKDFKYFTDWSCGSQSERHPTVLSQVHGFPWWNSLPDNFHALQGLLPLGIWLRVFGWGQQRITLSLTLSLLSLPSSPPLSSFLHEETFAGIATETIFMNCFCTLNLYSHCCVPPWAQVPERDGLKVETNKTYIWNPTEGYSLTAWLRCGKLGVQFHLHSEVYRMCLAKYYSPCLVYITGLSWYLQSNPKQS